MSSSTPSARGRMPVAKRDRRPMLAALAVLLILLGALGSALLVFRSGDRAQVLSARQDIEFGQKVTREDFSEVRAAADTPGVIPASDLKLFLNSYANGNIPAGSLPNPKMFTKQPAIPDGAVVVGLTVDQTRRPSDVPAPGQVVRLFYVAGKNGAEATGPNPVVGAARVVAIGSGADSSSRSISVLVSESAAAQVTNLASSGNIAVAILPNNTAPGVDWGE